MFSNPRKLILPFAIIAVVFLILNIGTPFSIFNQIEDYSKEEQVALPALRLPDQAIATALKMEVCSDDLLLEASENSKTAKKVLNGIKLLESKIVNHYKKDSFLSLLAKIFNQESSTVKYKSCFPPLVVGGSISNSEQKSKNRLLLGDQVITCSSDPKINSHSIAESINIYINYLKINKIEKKIQKKLRNLEKTQKQLRLNQKRNKTALQAVNREIINVKIVQEYARLYLENGVTISALYDSLCQKFSDDFSVNLELPAPTNLVYTANNRSLAWQGLADYFLIYTSQDGSNYLLQGKTTSNSHELSELIDGSEYYLKVLAVKTINNQNGKIHLTSKDSEVLKIDFYLAAPILEPTPVSSVVPIPTVSPTPTNSPTTTPTPTVSPTPIVSPTPSAVNPNEIVSSSRWHNKGFARQTSNFRISFKISALENNIDAVTGLSNGLASEYDSLGPIIRLNTTGQIEARNGYTYSAEESLNYVLGKVYLITLDVDLVSRKYSATAKNDLNQTYQIATNYAFRSSQFSVTELNNLGIFAYSGSLKVFDITSPVALITPTPSSSPTATPILPPSTPTPSTPTPNPSPTATPILPPGTPTPTSPSPSPSPTATPILPTGTATPSPPPVPGEIISSSNWQNKSFSNQTGSFRLTAKVTPLANNIDSVLGFSNGVASNYDSLAPIIRFANTGFIDARNGDTYSSLTSVPYSNNITYVISIDIHLSLKKYSASVKIGSGNPVLIADNFSFRTSQSQVALLNNLGVFSQSGSYKIFEISAPTVIIIPPQNGTCGSSINYCNSGTFRDLADNSTQYLWECLGESGGTNASCTSEKGSLGVVKDCSSISQYGITWYFDGMYKCGKFINGDNWVKGPITLNKVTVTAVTFSNGVYSYKVQDSDVWNGTTLNPRVANEGPNAVRPQGFGSYSGYVRYDSNLNIADKLSKLIPAGTTIATISTNNGQAGGAADRKQLATYFNEFAVLTVLAEIPPADAFRPAYAGAHDRSIKYRRSNVNMGIFKNLPVTGTLPDRQKIITNIKRPLLDFVISPSANPNTSFKANNLEMKSNGLIRTYGREISIGSIQAASYLNYNVGAENKEEVAIHLIQWGIDVAGLANDGMVWGANGGHHMGRKLPLIIAAEALNNADMKRQANFTQNNIFHEDQQHFIVTKEDVACSKIKGPTFNPPRTPYSDSHIGMPEWKSGWTACDASPSWTYSGYRSVNGDVNKSLISVLNTMGITHYWNNVLFRYITERYVNGG